jgi:hypothetical protein
LQNVGFAIECKNKKSLQIKSQEEIAEKGEAHAG